MKRLVNLTENAAMHTFKDPCKVAIEYEIAMDILFSNNQCEY